MIEAVRALFASEEDNKKLADLIEAAAPNCGCETFSVGIGSPGPVAPTEVLHRILSSPRDFDPDTGTVLEAPFRKVYTNGLSVWRARGTDDDVAVLMEESLWRAEGDPLRSISGVLEAQTSEIQAETTTDGSRCFCVYDQTVSRRDPSQAPVPTHAGVFLRVPAKGSENRTTIQKDLAGKLKELFERTFLDAESYRDGICIQLNERSASGEFIGGG